FSMPTASKRFLMVLVDSSMAMMPLPGATMARATLSRSSILMTAPYSEAIPARSRVNATPGRGGMVKAPDYNGSAWPRRIEPRARSAAVAGQLASVHQLLLPRRIVRRVERHDVVGGDRLADLVRQRGAVAEVLHRGQRGGTEVALGLHLGDLHMHRHAVGADHIGHRDAAGLGEVQPRVGHVDVHLGVEPDPVVIQVLRIDLVRLR